LVIGSATEFARALSFPRGFHGLVDEVHLFGRAVSADVGSNEIAAIYLAGSTGTCGVAPPSPAFEISVNKATVRLDRRGRLERDRFDVEGVLRLPDDLPLSFNPATDAVTVEFAGVFLQTIPAGSFVRKDDKWDFKTGRRTPGIRRVDLHFDGRFKIQARGPLDVNVREVDFTGPRDFSISIGPSVGETQIQLDSRLHLRSGKSGKS